MGTDAVLSVGGTSGITGAGGDGAAGCILAGGGSGGGTVSLVLQGNPGTGSGPPYIYFPTRLLPEGVSVAPGVIGIGLIGIDGNTLVGRVRSGPGCGCCGPGCEP